MKNVLRFIDSINDWQAKWISRWFIIALTIVVVQDVTMRYVFNAPTMWAHETAIMLGGGLYAMGYSYCQRLRGHIRIDIFYGRLSLRKKALVDVLGALIFFFPLMLIVIDAAFAWTWRAWVINEKAVETYWYPPIAPFRTVFLLGLCLYTLQGIAQFIRDLYLLVRNRAYD